MKKFFAVLLTVLMMLTCTACGNSAEKAPAPDKPVEAAKPEKILVAYFSCTGHTKKAALEVAEILKADTFEIVPAEAYTPADLDYSVENCRANVEQKDSDARPAIAVKISNPAQYKAIVIAFPIWWGTEPRIIDTFVESYDLAGKTIVPVCTSGGSDIVRAENDLRELCKVANVTEGKRLGISSKDDVKAWLDTLKL